MEPIFGSCACSRLTTPSSATAERGAVAAWWSEVEAYELEKRWLGRDGSELEIAATVTRGAVRCSAWLGHALSGKTIMLLLL